MLWQWYFLHSNYLPFSVIDRDNLIPKIVKKFSQILFWHSDLNRIQIRNSDLAESDHVELQGDIYTNKEDFRKLRL